MSTIVRPEVTATPPARDRRRRGRAPVVATVLGLAAILLLGLLVVARIHARDDADRDYLAASGWPAHGQAAYRIGRRAPRVSPHESPVPIASLAKVMTARIVLHDFPLRGGQPGFRMTVTPGDVAGTVRRQRADESVVPVRAGEVLTERFALLALLLPSANNIAAMLARRDAGSVAAFVAKMNREARRLRMNDTAYTDPSGYDATTRSTAADQLRLAEAMAGDQIFDALVATRSVTLPVAGTVTNTDLLLGSDGFVGTKTGSDDDAGSCFMFRAYRNVHRHLTQVVGVVLGQPGSNLITSGQYAARQLVDRIAPTSGAA